MKESVKLKEIEGGKGLIINQGICDLLGIDVGSELDIHATDGVVVITGRASNLESKQPKVSWDQRPEIDGDDQSKSERVQVIDFW